MTFLGVSTLLFDDGETAIMTDGFFTRPNAGDLFLRKISPDKALIARTLERAGIKKLAAIIVMHSHYDHAMDAPEVALQTGAVLVGSDSTANVGRGWGLPEDRILVRTLGSVLDFGRFRLTLLPSGHVPSGYPQGEITQPLRPPVRANEYLLGTVYALRVEHDGRAMIVNASAGFSPGGLAQQKADTIFLGLGALGKSDDANKNEYWRETVEASGAKRVVAIHWDDFTKPLDMPLQPLPNLFDDFDASMTFLKAKGAAQGVEIVLPQAWTRFDPFAGK